MRLQNWLVLRATPRFRMTCNIWSLRASSTTQWMVGVRKYICYCQSLDCFQQNLFQLPTNTYNFRLPLCHYLALSRFAMQKSRPNLSKNFVLLYIIRINDQLQNRSVVFFARTSISLGFTRLLQLYNQFCF